MALTKDKKQQVIDDIDKLLSTSKLTVIAAYNGTNVKSMQSLRKDAKLSNTTIKVIKNRLVIKAIKQNDNLKNIDTSYLKGQLMYAFNSKDEVAPAQNLATFAKKHPNVQFVGGISNDGQLLSSEDIKALAALPSKEQLRGQLVGTIGAPLSGFINILNGNLKSVLYALNARAETIK